MYAILFLPTSELLKEPPGRLPGLLYSNLELKIRYFQSSLLESLITYKRLDYNVVQKDIYEYIEYFESLREIYTFPLINDEFENQCNINLYEIIEV